MLKRVNQYILLVRPHQWLKNLLLLFPPFFGGNITSPSVQAAILPALLSFSFAASCGYILNDIQDREFDRQHSFKKRRPLACGGIPIAVAVVICAILYIAAILLSSSVSSRFEGYLIIYLFISFLYSVYFKHIIIVDMFFISFGFLMRILAGGEAFHTPISKWLFLAVFMVALFLSAGKRLGELASLGDAAGIHRKSLIQYSQSFLEGTLWFTGSASIVTYALYSIENQKEIFYTVPIAVFGILRYIFIAKNGNGDPTNALLSDGQIMIAGVLWLSVIGITLYR